MFTIVLFSCGIGAHTLAFLPLPSASEMTYISGRVGRSTLLTYCTCSGADS